MNEEWIGTSQAARLIGISQATVQRTLRDPNIADRYWGEGNWTQRSGLFRRIYLIRRARAEQMRDLFLPKRIPG